MPFFIVSQVGATSSGSPTERTLTDLRCEYLADPLGIDVTSPRLSWRLSTSDPKRKGFSQQAYRILVAESEEALDENRGALWDSGWVQGKQSTQILYKGKPLHSDQDCWWKVQILDEKSHRSTWSFPAHWSMGLLSRTDWKGHWIGVERPVQARAIMPDPWFRKTFEVASPPKRALIHLASIGYHELYINGTKVSDAVLAPGVSDLSKRARYRTYDIAKYLHVGTNAVGVWLGTGWSAYSNFPSIDRQAQPKQPLFILQGSIHTIDSKQINIQSDTSWKSHESSSQLLGTWDFTNFGGEEVDGRKKIANWSNVKLDDSDWLNAQEYHPRVALSSEMIEPNLQVHPLRAQKIEWVSEGWRVDMGQNFTGWIELAVHGEPGTRVDIDFSERKEAEITHRLHSAYIIGPSGKGVFRNRFNYSVGRWITIKGLDYEPTKDDIEGWLVRTGYDRASAFNCSDDLLNWIYNTSLWTFECLTIGGYTVDCPQRERMGYGGDAHATTQLGLNNYRLGAFYTKWAQDWRDSQSADGNMPYTAPTYWGGGGPIWSSYVIFMPWKVYQWYGDRKILETQYSAMKRFLAFEETHAKDDLLVRWGGDWDFLGDWLWPHAQGVNGDTQETLFLNNAYWSYALHTIAQIAKVLGNHSEAARYEVRSRQVANAVHHRFYNSKDHSYVSGTQQYLAAALLANIPPKGVQPHVWKRLEDEILVKKNGHIDAGITGGALLTRLLLDNHRSDLLYTMAIQKDYPSWGEFRRLGMTTIPEDWESSLSLTHSSYLYIGALFVEGILGIKPNFNGAGYQDFSIAPLIDATPKLDSAEGEMLSPYGQIRCGWKWKGNLCRLTLTVPPNTKGTLILPKGYSIQGRIAGNLRLVPGNYDFSVTRSSSSSLLHSLSKEN